LAREEPEGKRDDVLASIIIVGTEILKGLIVDTNSVWLIRKLNSLGVPIRNVLVVRDDIDDIANAVNFSMKRSNLIIIVGGLGPTIDDVTREGVSKALGRSLIISEELLSEIKKFYRAKGKAMTKERIKMGYIIEGAKVLSNPVGVAPGQKILHDDHIIYILPGPPKELKSIFIHHIERELKKLFSNRRPSRFIYILRGVGESDIAPFLSSFTEELGKKIYIKTILSSKEIKLVIECWTDDCKAIINKLISELEKICIVEEERKNV